MLYYIDNKIYILSGGYFREVTVDKISEDNYDVKVKEDGKKIEYVHNEVRPQVSLKKAYEKSHKKSLKD